MSLEYWAPKSTTRSVSKSSWNVMCLKNTVPEVDRRNRSIVSGTLRTLGSRSSRNLDRQPVRCSHHSKKPLTFRYRAVVPDHRVDGLSFVSDLLAQHKPGSRRHKVGRQ